MTEATDRDAPIYSQRQLDKFSTITRKDTRKNVWKSWFWSMLFTVAIAACARRQQFIEELNWYWIPLIAGTVNAICFWLAIRAYWGNPK